MLKNVIKPTKIGAIKLSESKSLVLETYQTNGKTFIDIREWYLSDNTLKPGVKGISINKTVVGELLDILAGQEGPNDE